MNTFKITSNDANQTIFKFLKKAYSTTPLSVIYKWFRKKDIKLNGKRINDQKIVLKEGDIIDVYDTNKAVVRDTFKHVENNHVDVVYEDDNMLVVNKPANVEMHSDFNYSLDDMVKTYLVDKGEYDPEAENSFVVSHVHRLDKLTQGLVMYAKNKEALNVLLTAIKDHKQIQKEYVAKVAKGFPEELVGKGYIYYNQDDQRSYFDLKKTDKMMKDCKTVFTLISSDDSYSLINAKITTGRKHQIRATLAYYNYPIVNDFRYGGQKINSEKMIFLKAYKLSFSKFDGDFAYLNGKVIQLDTNF